MPLTAAETGDARRFAGYSVAAAFGLQGLDVQGSSIALDAVLAALTDGQCITARTVYLAPLTALEASLFLASDGLDTAKAAVWTRNPAEMAEREALFMATRRRFCAWLGIPPGDGVFVGGAAGSSSAVAPAVFTV